VVKRAADPAKRFEQLSHETARQLRCKLTDPRVEHVAMLKLMRENIQARLLLNEKVDTADVLRLDEALRAYMPVSGSAAANEPHTIKIAYVEGVTGIYRCLHCGKQNELAEGHYKPAVEAKTTLPARAAALEPKDAPQATASRLNVPVERPYHETHVKDSRPGAARNSGADGSVVWGSTLSKYKAGI
jgi:hypothetical protein